MFNLTSKSSYYCKKCGKQLTAIQSIIHGVGPVCLSREMKLRKIVLYNEGMKYPKILKDDEDVKED